MLPGRKSSLINVVFFLLFLLWRLLTSDLLPQPSAASRHFNSASAGISCFDEVSRMNHSDPAEASAAEISTYPGAPPPPYPSPPSLSLSPLFLYLPLFGQQIEESNHVTSGFPALCRPLLSQNRLVSSEKQTELIDRQRVLIKLARTNRKCVLT